MLLTILNSSVLKGLIQNAEPEEVQLVEDMVVSHIKGNCLILAALPVTGLWCSLLLLIYIIIYPVLQTILKIKRLYDWPRKKIRMVDVL